MKNKSANKPSRKKESKLFALLRSFSKTELTQLRKFVDSPYFHNTTDVIQLFDIIRKEYPDFSPTRVSDEALVKKLFKSKNGSLKKVKNFRSDLYKLIERFLITKQLEKQPLQKHLLLAQAYSDHNFPDLYNLQKKKIKTNLEHQPSKGLHGYYYKLQFSHLQYFHPDTSKFANRQELLTQLMTELDEYYATAKIMYNYEIVERSEKLQESYQVMLLDEAVSLAEHHDLYNKNITLQLYKQLSHLKEHSINESLFDDIQNTLFSSLDRLSKFDSSNIFIYLINYTIRAISNHHTSFVEKQFELYKKGLNAKLLLNNGRITSMSVINISMLAIRLNKLDWLDHFLDDYQEYMNPKEAPNIIKYVMAIREFGNSHFEEALILTRNLQFENLLLKTAGESLTIKILFELFLKDRSYQEPLTSKITAFKRWISSSPFTVQKQQSYLNYLKTLQSIIKYYSSPNTSSQDWSLVKSSIEQMPVIIQKNWVLDKIQSITTAKEG